MQPAETLRSRSPSLRPGFTVTLRTPALVAAIAAIITALFPQCFPVASERPSALVASDRSGHLLDRPYPSDELRSPLGGVALTGFPAAASAVGQLFVDGWLAQTERVARGFSATTPIYFRFVAQPQLADRYEGRITDPVLLISLDTYEAVPVNVRWISDSLGDPYLPDGTLIVSPDETRPLRAGHRYLATVSRRFAERAPGWMPPPEAKGFDSAVATVFTVQDHVAELDALRRATDALLDGDPSLLQPQDGLREVASLALAPGTTPGGRPATVLTTTFVGGETEVGFRAASSAAAQTIDLTTGPMAVYQATIRTAAFQDATGRPYQSTGLGIIGDTGRSDGWIEFDAAGALLRAPTPEPMRVVVLVPRSGSGFALLDWGHGSGGDAYEPIARTDPMDDLAALRLRIAELGAILVSGDHPLFGQRFPYMELGFDNDLLVVNIPNLPAFRANFQQGAVDQHVRRRFAREVLPDLLGPGMVDPSRRQVAFGHSIGAQIAGIAAGFYREGDLLAPDAQFLNGTGGQLTHSVVASDLLQIQGGVGEAIFVLAGLAPDPDATPNEVLGALLGVPEAAWPNVDRMHPLALPFQLLVDGADPLAVAREHAIAVDVMGGENDSKVPPEGFVWLAEASRRGSLAPCTPSTPFDGHVCVFREPEGLAGFARLLGAE